MLAVPGGLGLNVTTDPDKVRWLASWAIAPLGVFSICLLVIAAIFAVLVLIDFGKAKWPRVKAAIVPTRAIVPEFIPLMEAAQIVYEATRHSLAGVIARNKGLAAHDDPVVHTANLVVQHVDGVGKIRGSTVYDPIPHDKRDRLFVTDDGKHAGRAYADHPDYFDVRVRASELLGLITRFNDWDKEKDSDVGR